ncbi:transposase [Rhodococcus sp. USK13]|uniref:IS1634 family transposase n=1 Tax=Rhodococcus sp. USK13 TaxID=2806442 RepID=UPI001BD1952D|nr:transposase [Rhodococcus sp. USK13]
MEICCFEGNHAEIRTIVPIARQFQERHGIEGVEMIIAADAGMLSATNLKDLDAAGLEFIVGSRVMKAPSDLASHLHWNGDVFSDEHVIDTVTPRHAKSVVNDIARRAEPRCGSLLTRPRVGRSGRTRKNMPWVTTRRSTLRRLGPRPSSTVVELPDRHGSSRRRRRAILDTEGNARAPSFVVLKGYLTNLSVPLMNPHEVMAKYHDLWQVEQSFRMSKTDLRARPIFSHTRDSIEAHLTIVFAALAISRYLQAETGTSIPRIVRTLRPLQEITVSIAGHEHAAADPLTDDAVSILDALEISNPRSVRVGTLNWCNSGAGPRDPCSIEGSFDNRMRAAETGFSSFVNGNSRSSFVRS